MLEPDVNVQRKMIVSNPATEQPLAVVEAWGADEVNAAVRLSKRAYPEWSKVSPSDRALLLRRLANLVTDNLEALARMETDNVGKPISDSRDEVAMVAEVFNFYAGAIDKFRGDTIPVAGGIDMTFNEPLGVVGAIVPWNFPIAITSWKVGPALACGNSIIVKPAELTPLSAVKLADLALDAGIPPGVFQVVPGHGQVAGSALVVHEDVAKIAFTGSSEVGRSIMAKASKTLKRVTLELGGKSSNIIFEDADLDKAASAAPMAVFGNAGQDCCARSRILIQRSIYDDFVDLLVAASAAIEVGDPLDEDTQMGPLISSDHLDRVKGFIDPLGESLEVIYQGASPGGPGHWFAPMLVSTSDPTNRVFQEEIFGPIACLIAFDDEEDAVRLANETCYGLSGSIWTRDGARALRMARSVASGNLSINSNSSVRVATPFGGMKQSGFGRELGLEALLSYSDVKNVFYSTS